MSIHGDNLAIAVSISPARSSTIEGWRGARATAKFAANVHHPLGVRWSEVIE